MKMCRRWSDLVAVIFRRLAAAVALLVTTAVLMVFAVLAYPVLPFSFVLAVIGVAALLAVWRCESMWGRVYFSIPALIAALVWIGHLVDPWVDYRIYQAALCDLRPFPFGPSFLHAARDSASGDFYITVNVGFVDPGYIPYRFAPGSRFPQRVETIPPSLIEIRARP